MGSPQGHDTGSLTHGQLELLTRFLEKIFILPLMHREFCAETLPQAYLSGKTISNNPPYPRVLVWSPLRFYLLRRLWISWGWSSLLVPQWRMGLKVVGSEDLASRRGPQVCL